jgi:5-methylcytosine-specific restriction endonuclease McrA
VRDREKYLQYQRDYHAKNRARHRFLLYDSCECGRDKDKAARRCIKCVRGVSPRHSSTGERICLDCGISVGHHALRCPECRRISKSRRMAEQDRRRAAQKRGTQVERLNYDDIWARDFGICHICGEGVDRRDTHFDHVIPLSRGGEHVFDNVRTSHSRCNVRKSDKLLEEMAA